jgi:hypothetical protein
VADRYDLCPRPPVAIHEHGPVGTVAEQRREWHLQHVLRLPQQDSRLDAVAVPERAPALRRLGNVDDDPDSLLLDAERRDLRVAVGLHAPHDAFERVVAAPAFDERTLPGPHLDGFGGEQVRDDLEPGGIANFQQRRP